MDAVHAAAMAVGAQGHGGKPLPLIDLMALAGAGAVAHDEVHLFDGCNVATFSRRHGWLIFALH